MQTRFWLFALAFGCALLVVQATEEAATKEAATEEKVVAPIAAEEENLEARYPGGFNRGGGEGGWNNGGRNNGGRGKNGWNGGNGRRGDSNNDSSDNGNGRGRGAHGGNGGGHGGGGGNIAEFAGRGLRNKVINLGTRNYGTKRTYSGSRKVVSSRKDNYFNKNFVNTVVENLKTVRKVVHTDTKILVKKPLTVDNLKVHQQTNYVKNIYPHLEKVWIERYGEVIKPAHLTQVSRSASASKRTIRHRLQVSSKSRSQNLGVKYELAQNLGVNNLGYNGNNNNNDSSNNNSSNNRNHRRNRGGSRGGRRGNRNNNNSSNNNHGCRGEYC